MQTFTVEEAARRWLSAPKLDPETEREAAEATIAFLTDVRSKIEAHLEDILRLSINSFCRLCLADYPSLAPRVIFSHH